MMVARINRACPLHVSLGLLPIPQCLHPGCHVSGAFCSHVPEGSGVDKVQDFAPLDPDKARTYLLHLRGMVVRRSNPQRTILTHLVRVGRRRARSHAIRGSFVQGDLCTATVRFFRGRCQFHPREQAAV